MTTQLSEKIRAALNQMESTNLAEDLWQILQQQKLCGFLPHFALADLYQKYQLNEKQLALALLPVAACYATTPVSNFNVGAIAIGKNGDFYFGANQEFANSNIQQSVHAEQSAISHAWMRGESFLRDIAVNYTPCGHCRQFMNELNSAESLQIHLPHRQNNRLQQYLPDAFGPLDLNIKSRLLDRNNHQLQFNNDDPLIQQALQMANQAHAPYSQSYHGVAIQTRLGNIYGGSYAENAAFNPSLPAMQVALNYLLLSGEQIADIARVVMVEQATQLRNYTMAKELLAVVCNIPLEYIEL